MQQARNRDVPGKRKDEREREEAHEQCFTADGFSRFVLGIFQLVITWVVGHHNQTREEGTQLFLRALWGLVWGHFFCQGQILINTKLGQK